MTVEPRLIIHGESGSSVRASNEAREALAKLRAEAGSASTAEKGLGEASARAASEQTKLARAHASGRSELDKAARGALVGSGAFRSLGRSIAFASATFLGTAGFIRVVSDSITGASDLREQIEKTNDVFRASGPQVIAWSRGLATSFGIAQREALAFTSTFGNMLVPMGVAPTKAAEMSKKLVELSADVAAFNNLPLSDVLEKMRAGLAGMPRPLRTVGVFLDQTRIKAEAVADGFVKATRDGQKIADAETKVSIAHAKLDLAQRKYGAGTTQVASATVALHTAQSQLEKAVAGNVPTLDAQAKAMAAYQIILKDTRIQQGNFSKTSGDLAQQSKILHAEIGNLQDELGAQLLPTVTAVTTAVTKWLAKSENQERIQRDLHQATQAVTTAVKELWPEVQKAAKFANDVANYFGGWNNVLKVYLGYKVASKVLGEESALRKLSGVLGGLTKSPWKINLQLIGGVVIGLLLRKLQEQLDKLTGAGTVPGGRTPVGKGYYYDPKKDMFTPPGGEHANIFISYEQAAKELGITVDELRKKVAGLKREAASATTAVMKAIQPATATLTGGKSVQIPTSFTPTHETAGLAGFPAVDIMATPGTGIGAPEDGVITRISGNEPSSPPPQGPGGPWGLSIYFVGNETGNTYYMTHLLKVATPGHYRKGDIIGIIGNYPGRPSHVHLGIHQGASAEAGYNSGFFKPSDYLAKPSSATTTSARATSATDAGRGADKGPPASSKPLRVAVSKAPPSIRALLDAAFGIAVAKAERTTKVSDDLHVIAAELRWIDAKLADKGLGAADRLDLEQTKTDLLNSARDIEKGQHDKQKAAADKLAAAFKAQQDAAPPSHAALVRAAGVFRGGDVGAVGVAASRATIDRIGATQAEIAKKARAEHKKMLDGIAKDLQQGLDRDKAIYKRVGDDLSAALDRAKKIAVAKAKDLAAGMRLATPISAELAKLGGGTQLTVGSDLFGRPLKMSVDAAKQRVDELVAIIKNGSAKARQAAIDELSKIADGVSGALSDASAAAQAALDKATSDFQQMFERVASQVLTAFDRETQRGIDSMNKDAQARINALSTAAQAQIDELTKAMAAQVTQMQADLQRQVDAVSAATDAAIQKLQARADARIKAIQDQYSAAIQAAQDAGQALTPAEQALKDLQDTHDEAARAQAMADAQKALADAQAGGDPQAIKAAQDVIDQLLYEDKVRELQKEADAERKARDDETVAKIKALQDQQAAAEKAIQDELAAREKALQDEAAARTKALQDAEAAREATLQAGLQAAIDAINAELATRTQTIQDETTAQIQGYQDERDAQRQLLADQLADWEAHLANREADWSAFITWLNGTTGSFSDLGQSTGGAFAQTFLDELKKAGLGFLLLLGAAPPGTSLGDLIQQALNQGNANIGDHLPGYQHGGVVPGWRGRGRIILAHGGERVLSDRDQRVLSRHLSGTAPTVDPRDLAGSPSSGGAGPSVTVQVIGGTFLGRDDATGRAIARIVEPHIKRRLIGFDAYRG